MAARFIATLPFDVAILTVLFVYSTATVEVPSAEHTPTVLIAILASNHAYTLPDFLGYLERQDYPKDKLSLW